MFSFSYPYTYLSDILFVCSGQLLIILVLSVSRTVVAFRKARPVFLLQGGQHTARPDETGGKQQLVQFAFAHHIDKARHAFLPAGGVVETHNLKHAPACGSIRSLPVYLPCLLQTGIFRFTAFVMRLVPFRVQNILVAGPVLFGVDTAFFQLAPENVSLEKDDWPS